MQAYVRRGIQSVLLLIVLPCTKLFHHMPLHVSETTLYSTTGIAVTLYNTQLVKLLQKAYSAEKAASYAYQGHAASVKNPLEKIAIRQIEEDEWNHRKEVLSNHEILQHTGIKIQ